MGVRTDSVFDVFRPGLEVWFVRRSVRWDSRGCWKGELVVT